MYSAMTLEKLYGAPNCWLETELILLEKIGSQGGPSAEISC
jgi:hypothetical protein